MEHEDMNVESDEEEEEEEDIEGVEDDEMEEMAGDDQAVANHGNDAGPAAAAGVDQADEDNGLMIRETQFTYEKNKTIYVTDYGRLGLTFKSMFRPLGLNSHSGVALVRLPQKGIYYVGDIVRGQPHGKGFISSKDYICEGTFVEGKLQGRAVYIWSQQTRYEGEFVRGKKHGRGALYWTDGSFL
eukprot:TRINITY_DN2822_c0_g1_i2.p1 TRINITY_DN2822_c0_g1~~TRINITY_DN2822_c0_g1_i2.p1  ORF type:complete len:185 (-),score=37.67 TRINITY_DN2822_c0_g1_i2:423-977(-)